MIGYASRTGTRSNLAALRAAGWRLLVNARGVLRTEGFPYALDNGAFSAFVEGKPFDFPKFERAVEQLGGGPTGSCVPMSWGTSAHRWRWRRRGYPSSNGSGS